MLNSICTPSPCGYVLCIAWVLTLQDRSKSDLHCHVTRKTKTQLLGSEQGPKRTGTEEITPLYSGNAWNGIYPRKSARPVFTVTLTVDLWQDVKIGLGERPNTRSWKCFLFKCRVANAFCARNFLTTRTLQAETKIRINRYDPVALCWFCNECEWGQQPREAKERTENHFQLQVRLHLKRIMERWNELLNVVIKQNHWRWNAYVCQVPLPEQPMACGLL